MASLTPVDRPRVVARVMSGLLLAVLVILRPAPTSAATPDQVLEWTSIMEATIRAANTNPLISTRQVAIVEASIFDAVNGIERRYQPLHVRHHAPRHASPRAAAIQAAYAALIRLYPGQMDPLTARRMASIAALSDPQEAIDAGLAWGQTVADAIWTWRSTDGFDPPPPPFLGVLGIVGMPAAVGLWRPTPPANASGSGPQWPTMTPFVLIRPSQFRLPPPPALTSEQYAADLIETKTMGAYEGSLRTDDQSQLALFWAGNTALFWNRIALQLASGRDDRTLIQNAHLFAVLNVAMVDAALGCWDSKYRYQLWRPITAIRYEGSDPNWRPWLEAVPPPGTPGTPAHPEYPSGHSTVSGAAGHVVAAAFGDETSFTVTSEVLPGVVRSFARVSDAIAEIMDARVFGGIHFRTACVRGKTLGEAVASYVTHALRSRNGDEDHE